MLEWLKWKLARAEMQELYNWRSSWYRHRRWFAEFDAAATALDHMRSEVNDERAASIIVERDDLRKRMAANAGHKPPGEARSA